MRCLVAFLLVACTSSHTLRVQAVDGLTGAPRPGEHLTVKTFLTSTHCGGYTRERGEYHEEDIDNAPVTTGRDGWATIDMIEKRSPCDYRATGVEVFVRGAGNPIDIKTKGPVFVPVFDHWPRADSAERSYVAYRARDAFSRVAAVTSVYEERFIRVGNHKPIAFERGDLVLIGATPEIHADGDGDDPFVRVGLAKVTAEGTAWRIELTALELVPAAPEYIVPAGFENQRQQVAAWGAAMVDEIVLRAATAQHMIGRDYLETNYWGIVTHVDRGRFTADIVHDSNPYDGKPGTEVTRVRGELVRHDGRILVARLERVD